MILPQVLCTLLTSICHLVTGVESSLGPAGASGTAKKTEAMKGVNEVLDGLVTQGATFVRDQVEGVASSLIDHVVAAAHDIGAFVHHTPAAPADGPQP